MFPCVKQLSPRDLATWLTDSGRDQPQLLDVRTEEEFAVSHLPGARRVEPNATAEEVRRMLDPVRPVVVYCAGGYRSAKLAKRLMRAGVANVQNLEGALFAWANEGLPLERDGQPATTIHTCGRLSGILVKPERRAKSPSAKG
jgi:rhodanese-related sulfurtransferase